MPRPPFPRDWWQVIRLTVSIRDPQRKGQTRLFIFEITHLGTHKTAERYRSLLIPKTLIMSDLPTRERERDFQRLRCFSNFSSFGRQLSVSVSCPKTTPKIFYFRHPFEAKRLVAAGTPCSQPHGLGFCDIETSSRSTLIHINHSKQTLKRAIGLYNTGRIISIHTNFVT